MFVFFVLCRVFFLFYLFSEINDLVNLVGNSFSNQSKLNFLSSFRKIKDSSLEFSVIG